MGAQITVGNWYNDRRERLSIYRDGPLGPLSAAPRTPVLSSPIYGIFSLRSGEDSYTLFKTALIGRLHRAAGNRLTASLRMGSAGAGNQFQLKSREESVVGESNGKSALGRQHVCYSLSVVPKA